MLFVIFIYLFVFKQWNEVTKLFRAGVPLKKHRQHFRVYGNCFTATAAVDWLHDLLRSNSNFGPEVTRQQTVQLLKKFLKNHVIEDVKGRWGSEDLEDNGQLYRFPSTSPLKQIPRCPRLRKKDGSVKEKEAFFKFKSSKKPEREIKENVDPEIQEDPANSPPVEVVHRRNLTEDDILDIWRNITLTHLQKTLGLTSLEDLLDPYQVNPQHIVYNMTNVNKHGVVTLEDKTGDLPHWVLSAMKCLANWPKYDLHQPSYPGFERDVFKTVSDYFVNLPKPLLTYEYYEVFVNVLVLCGYVMIPKSRRGKRKNHDDPSCPQPPKTPYMNDASFKSTECLLLSLIRKESFDETDSPMREVLSCKAKSRLPALDKDMSSKDHQLGTFSIGASSSDIIGGSCQNLPRITDSGLLCVKVRPRSCSLEGIADCSDSHSRNKCRSVEELVFHRRSSSSSAVGRTQMHKDEVPLPPCSIDKQQVSVSASSLFSSTSSGKDDTKAYGAQTARGLRLAVRPERTHPRSTSSLTHTGECPEMSASSFSINEPVAEITVRPDSSSSVGLRRPSLLNLPGSFSELTSGQGVSKRCFSSVDLSNEPAAPLPSVSTFARHPSPDASLLQPQLERVAIEALQLCTLLLPPANRRKLQLLMRMISRMSQNVDMPRLHDAIGTRTLMVHVFSRCVLCCEEEVDLDELLATRLVSFLMDHHQEILQVPVYLQNAVQDHIAYLRKVQLTYPGPGMGSTVPTYSFCRQISPQEFEEQKLSVSQAAIAELLESLIKDRTLSVKEKKKKLKQFQKEYPDIYSRRFSTTESEVQLFVEKPKIKPPMLIGMKKAKASSVRN
ncbi:DEP domain-containing protein 1A-like [Scleropages formosus]|uniref:DEP domain-containing protein 1A-like n=1 Tax=Scleropages formosus TaxID=113540 RepID=A0A0P7X046_SCLFO|nr:DEP domain-containing protein 1A-like [Scleropages formosus]